MRDARAGLHRLCHGATASASSKALTMRMREGAHLDCRHLERANTAANSLSLCSPYSTSQAFGLHSAYHSSIQA